MQRFAKYSCYGMIGILGSSGCVYLTSLDHHAENQNRNEIVLLLSGKRYSGKDYICDRIQRKLNDYSISYKRFNHGDQMKRIYCESSGANLNLMLTNRIYKEKHRNAMTKLYQQISSNDNNKFIFCQSIYNQIINKCHKKECQVIIIGDFRRIHEEQFYLKHFDSNKVLTIRINALDQTRMNRGWIFNEKKDLNITECELDNKSDWNFVFENDGNEMDVMQWIDDLLMPVINNLR
eukprot:195473_1